jgi:hypothetical protein
LDAPTRANESRPVTVDWLVVAEERETSDDRDDATVLVDEMVEDRAAPTLIVQAAAVVDEIAV